MPSNSGHLHSPLFNNFSMYFYISLPFYFSLRILHVFCFTATSEETVLFPGVFSNLPLCQHPLFGEVSL